jgi:hypothetical protein
MAIVATFAAISGAHAGEVGEATDEDPMHLNTQYKHATIFDDLKIKGFLDAGDSINPALPFNNINFGQLYTDQANTPQLNQIFLTMEKPFTASPNNFDYRLMFQTLYGADARFHHVLGETEYLIPSRYQFAIVEAYTQLHFPVITDNGLDIKLGQYISYNAGIENIPSIDNLFYTRSYIYNAGPAQHLGIMGITHISDWMDIYTGVDSGVNTSIGWPGDNNAAAAIHSGVLLHFLDNKLTVAAFTHSGPENPMQKDPYNVGWPNIPLECGCDPNTTWRYYNNLTISYEPTSDWKFITDIAYYRDDGWNTFSSSGLSQDSLYLLDSFYNTDFSNLPQKGRGVQAYGIAQYVSYRYDDRIRINGRMEFWRDSNNFFTTSFSTPFSNANQQHGFPADVISQPIFANNPSMGTTYLATTVGVNFNLKFDKSTPIEEIILRPEARIDFTLNNSAPFIGSNTVSGRTSQKTISLDVLLPFTVK